jgi:hypothetical protein
MPLRLQALHAGHAAAAQQAPLVQWLLAHWPLLAHEMPLAETHCPLPLHACEPEHTGFVSVPSAGMLAQVPTDPERLHAWQVPLQALLQQTPSTQLPLRH